VHAMVTEQSAKSTDQKLDAKKLSAAAAMNRDIYINDGALPALKWLSEEPAVKTRLLDIASDKSLRDDAGKVRRARALAALEGRVTSADLSKVLELALDEGNPPEVRDYAFDRVGDIRSPQALDKLWPLVASSSDDRLRWRAGELVLSIGGVQVLAELMKKLPAGADFETEELEGYAQRIGQFTPAPSETMRQMLQDPAWFARIVALRYFERKGGAQDVVAVSALTGDAAPTKGKRWGKLKSVGSVAEDVSTSLKQRLAQPGTP
jgi:hypothetical protein